MSKAKTTFKCWEFNPKLEKLIKMLDYVYSQYGTQEYSLCEAKRNILFKAFELASEDAMQAYFDSVEVKSKHEMTKYKEYCKKANKIFRTAEAYEIENHSEDLTAEEEHQVDRNLDFLEQALEFAGKQATQALLEQL